MATLTKGKTFSNGELVTPQKIHELVDLGTVSNIVNSDISAGAAIADTKLATLATAGKVANSATTATNANTANAIVARDASGNFSAGTITAALSGNASSATTAAACSGNAATATTAASCSGNAATATTLQTARTINGVSFNGSANITVTAAPNAHTHDTADITSGTLANSRTTATSANTASAIVARDANGSFVSGNLIISGNRAGGGSTTEATNTVFGGGAPLQLLTTGSNNTAIGYDALAKTTSGLRNVAIGQECLFNTTTGQNNVGIGVLANNANTTGFSNTSVGDSALAASQTASYNTAVGRYALNNHLTNGYNTAIGYQANGFTTNGANTTCLGANSSITAANQVQLGDSATTTYAYGAVQNRSDARDKTDIRDTELGLAFVKALRPVDFKWDMREDYRPESPAMPSENATEEEKEAYKIAKDKWLEDVKLANITHDGSKKRGRFHHGLIAQEVKAVLDAKGIDFGGFQDHGIKGGDDVLSIGYVELIAPLIKAVQELAARVEALETANS